MGMQPFGAPHVAHHGTWAPQPPQFWGSGMQCAPRAHAPHVAGTMQPPPPLHPYARQQSGKVTRAAPPQHPPPSRHVSSGSERGLSSEDETSGSGNNSPHVAPQISATVAQQKNRVSSSEGPTLPEMNTPGGQGSTHSAMLLAPSHNVAAASTSAASVAAAAVAAVGLAVAPCAHNPPLGAGLRNSMEHRKHPISQQKDSARHPIQQPRWMAQRKPRC